jgi:hypothetical protein
MDPAMITTAAPMRGSLYWITTSSIKSTMSKAWWILTRGLSKLAVMKVIPGTKSAAKTEAKPNERNAFEINLLPELVELERSKQDTYRAKLIIVATHTIVGGRHDLQQLPAKIVIFVIGASQLFLHISCM